MKVVDKSVPISAICMTIVDNGIWAVHATQPILYFVNSEQEKVTFWKVIPYNEQTDILYHGIYVHGDDIILIPDKASEVTIYNIQKDEFYQIAIEGESEGFFRNYVKDNNGLYLIPNYYEKMVYLDLNDYSISYLKGREESFADKSISGCISLACKYQDDIIGVLYKSNTILIYNIKKNEWNKQQVRNYQSITRLCSFADRIYAYDIDSKCIIELNLEDGQVIKSLYIGYKEVMLYCLGKYGIVIDSECDDEVCLVSLELELINRQEVVKNRRTTSWKFGVWDNYEGNILGITAESNLYGIENQKFVFKNNLEICDNIASKLLNAGHKMLLQEDGVLTVEKYIEWILS